jgi:hypothetical protein
MTYYFSPSFLSFYTDAVIPVNNMPIDVIGISEQTYNAVHSGIAKGLIVKVGANNQPILVNPTPAPLPQLTLPQIIAKYAAALTNAINLLAASWQYDNITSAATYLNSSIPQFAAEARVLVQYRDHAWASAQELLAKVEMGVISIPATVDTFLAMVLPPTPQRPTA